MYNNSDFKNSKNQDYSKKQIEALINKIIDKNKLKLKQDHKIKNDFEFLNKHLDKRDRIYFVKEKDKKKKKNNEVFSGEIINEAREKLGKEPINMKKNLKESNNQEFLNENKNNDDNKKKKIKIKFGKRKVKYDKTDYLNKNQNEINNSDEVLNENDYEKIIDKIELEVDKIKQKSTKNPLSTNKEKEDFFEENYKEINNNSSTIQLTEKNKKFENTDNTNEVDFKKDKLNEENQIDKNSKNIFSNSLFKKDTKNTDTKDNKHLKSKKEINLKNSDEKEIKEDFIPPPPTINKPKFKVDNIPKSENPEGKLIDEKIKNNSDLNNKEIGNKNPEDKAKTIAKTHIKNYKPSKTDIHNNKNKKMFSQSLDIDNESDQEHMFFDEDVSFEGWSPHNPDINKQDIQANNLTELQKELQKEDLGEIKNIELPKEALSVDSVKLSDLGFSENEWEELDFYPLHEPFAYVEVLRERETLEKRYFLVEVELTDDEKKVLDFIKETIFHMSIETEDLELKGEEDYLAKQIDGIVKEYNLDIKKDSFEKILYYFSKESLGFGKIDPLMQDPNIEDISCDGSNIAVFLYHRKYGSLRSNIAFQNEDELSAFVFKLAQKCGKHISIAEPMVDATMPDGSRIQMTLSDEITAHGSTFTIRKFRSDPFSPPDLVEFNTMNSEMIAYMWLAIENGTNMLFAGGTASGKTSTLNALSLFIPPESKIVSIEETREINLPHPNWIPGVARSGFGEAVADRTIGQIDMYDLMKAALRQRPEYIIVGEIRGKEAYVLFQAMATGHATYSTVHADSAQSLIHRLEGKPINIPRVMLQSLDVVSLHIITKVNNKRARRCKQVIEIIDIDPTTKEILTNEVFRWDPVEDRFVYSGKSYVLERIRAEKDFSRDQITKELQNRMKLVEHMNNENIRGFRDVANLVSKYIDTPETVLKMIK